MNNLRLRFVALAGFAVLCLSIARACADSTNSVSKATIWAMFRGSPGLVGRTEAFLPQKPALLWRFKTGGPVKSSPAIVDGKVFFGSGDGTFYCVDASNGKKAWSNKTEGPIEASPLVMDKRVYFGSSDAHFYALEAATGKQLWKIVTGDKILGAANAFIGDDRRKHVLFGSYDYKLYCADAETGKTNWTFETGNYINGSPAVSQKQTVFGGCDALLHVVSLETGEKVKEVDAGAYIAGSGAFDKGRFYIGHYENEFLCADLNVGKIAWKFKELSFPYFSSPALTDDMVVFGGRDKQLHCLKRADGKPVWSFSTKGKVDSSPVIAKDKVVVGSDDGNLYMVSLSTGSEIWKYEIGEAVTSSPAVVNGLIVVGSDDGSVYAFGEKAKK